MYSSSPSDENVKKKSLISPLKKNSTENIVGTKRSIFLKEQAVFLTE